MSSTGSFEIAVAIKLRQELRNEWVLILSGALSVLFGVLVIAMPTAEALSIVWLIGAYAILFGIMMLALGFKLKGIVSQVRGATRLAEIPEELEAGRRFATPSCTPEISPPSRARSAKAEKEVVLKQTAVTGLFVCGVERRDPERADSFRDRSLVQAGGRTGRRIGTFEVQPSSCRAKATSRPWW